MKLQSNKLFPVFYSYKSQILSRFPKTARTNQSKLLHICQHQKTFQLHTCQKEYKMLNLLAVE